MSRTLAHRRTPETATWFTVIERGTTREHGPAALYGQVHAAACGAVQTACGIALVSETVRSSLPAVDFRVILTAAATTVCADCRRAVRLDQPASPDAA